VTNKQWLLCLVSNDLLLLIIEVLTLVLHYCERSSIVTDFHAGHLRLRCRLYQVMSRRHVERDESSWNHVENRRRTTKQNTRRASAAAGCALSSDLSRRQIACRVAGQTVFVNSDVTSLLNEIRTTFQRCVRPTCYETVIEEKQQTSFQLRRKNNFQSLES